MLKIIYNSFTKVFFYLLIVMIHFSCMEQISKAREGEIRQMIRDIRHEYVKDTRTAIFDINLERNMDGWLIEGITDQPEVLDRLLDSLERKSITYRNKVKILPDEDLNGKTNGLVNLSVANLRSEPDHRAELCTQAVLGTPLKVLQKQRSWYRVQTPDKYIGWLDESGLVIMAKEDYEQYQSEEKVIFTELWGNSYLEPDANSTPVSDLVAGSILQFISDQGEFFKIKYPDDRIGYLRKMESEFLIEWVDSRNPTAENLVFFAKRLMGIPYLWGGTSIKGVDCSGYTKTIYFMNGIILPRDASQQDDIGMLVDDKKFFNRLLPGDLLFFGTEQTDSTEERVVHVGMWIGDMKFIHASGDVNISSMNTSAPEFDEYNYNRYLKSKRILNSHFVDQLFIRKFY
jgi:cell wall-associated NlpC family hydrolase